MRNKYYLLTILLLIFTLIGCTPHDRVRSEQTGLTTFSSCHIIFDAGSSGTRLYIYEKRGSEWLAHSGPTAPALADPVREIRGKTRADIEPITTEIVNTLDRIKQPGPAQQAGQPTWPGFDWETQCHVASAQVYATAGMRLAEQQHRLRSARLWQLLHHKLLERLGHRVPIETRTLSGYEEGLFSWLAVRRQKGRDNFGIVELGGASSQVTFPCQTCAASDHLKTVSLAEGDYKIYSHSFLGLGQDEAPRALGMPRACGYGIAATDPLWRPSDCANAIPLTNNHGGIRDPYNYRNNQQGYYLRVPVLQADIDEWFLTGAFLYFNVTDITTCCAGLSVCYNRETSCFRPIYLYNYLAALMVPPNAHKLDSSWTEGALICAVNDCLRHAAKPVCDWSPQGCLSSLDPSSDLKAAAR